ncbi:MAG: hypothetical protein ABI969_04855 [bacterium]
MRAPLAAWRKLFAVGGAPWASHVALSRTPPADRLFDPLSGARVVHAASLDALTKSLDVGALFSRVTGVPVDEKSEASYAAEPGDSVRRTRAARSVAGEGVGAGGEHAREPVHEAALASAGDRARRSTAPTTSMPRAERAATIMRELGSARATRASASVETYAPRAEARVGMDVKSAERTRRITSNSFARSEATLSAGLPSDAQAGANARVVVGTPVADIERLLSTERPTRLATDVSPRAARTASTAEDERDRVRARAAGAGPDIASVLARAVSRAQRAAPATSADFTTTRRSLQLESTGGARDADASHHDGFPAADAPAASGFRGLAQRTLTHAHSSAHAPVKRIEAEKHVSADIMHDTLDARVADSLARVLEREARRHGIDIDEARA